MILTVGMAMLMLSLYKYFIILGNTPVYWTLAKRTLLPSLKLANVQRQSDKISLFVIMFAFKT